MSKPGLRRVCSRVLGDWTNLLLANGSAAAALILGILWPLLVGALSCLAFTLFRLSRPSFWHSLADEGEPLRLGELSGIREPELKALVSAFLAGRKAVEQALRETPVEIRSSLQGGGALDELEGCAAQLVLRAQGLADLLCVLTASTLDDELHQLEALAQKATDAETRTDLESVRSMKAEQLERIREVSAAREHTLARLLRCVAALKGLPARIVGLRILEAQLKDDVFEELSQALARIQAEFQTSEQTLRSVGALSSGTSA